ncbi:uncharacterized protein LOC111400852 isoform X2 [Olea europaea var. sylvestris]|uniref:uncharacterized protein LOC111400852 isoform X2 n=1 Tax=Olea europaea var. sylvestris TaxID=158386 RepID=UPI000C1D71C8|nr:uncharacterized protein LOC111400852 isoform X2 [Olea europaea var. sylvestris]
MAENNDNDINTDADQNQTTTQSTNTNSNTNHHDPSLPNSPYFIGANESSGALLVTQMLDANNYHSWARSIKRALRIKNKLGFIDGSLCAPADAENPLMELWLRCNDIVISWLQNTMTVDIKASTLYVETAHQLWVEIEQRLAQQNAPRIYEIKQGIAALMQGHDTARIALTQDEISKVGSQLEALKSDESSARYRFAISFQDGFIGKMLELNGQIRKFQESIASSFDAEKFCEATSNDGFLNAPAQDAHEARIDLENKLSQIISQTNVEEQEYHSEQVVYEQDLINLEKKALLLEAMKKESLELQELSGQTSELEEKCASHSDELHKRFICPCCHRDNSEELSGILQMSDGNEHLTSS